MSHETTALRADCERNVDQPDSNLGHAVGYVYEPEHDEFETREFHDAGKRGDRRKLESQSVLVSQCGDVQRRRQFSLQPLRKPVHRRRNSLVVASKSTDIPQFRFGRTGSNRSTLLGRPTPTVVSAPTLANEQFERQMADQLQTVGFCGAFQEMNKNPKRMKKKKAIFIFCLFFL